MYVNSVVDPLRIKGGGVDIEHGCTVGERF